MLDTPPPTRRVFVTRRGGFKQRLDYPPLGGTDLFRFPCDAPGFASVARVLAKKEAALLPGRRPQVVIISVPHKRQLSRVRVLEAGVLILIKNERQAEDSETAAGESFPEGYHQHQQER